MTRRETLTTSMKLAGAGALAGAATRLGGLQAFAQDAPANVLAGLGLPEIDVTVTDTGYEGLSSELAAGFYLVKSTNGASADAFIAFMQLPEGMTAADLAAMLAGGGTPETGTGDAAMASPVAGGGEGGAPPAWFYTTYMAGGAGIGKGATATFVIDLQPGNYAVWAEDPSAPQRPVDLTVTGEAGSPTPAAPIPANVVILEQATDTGFAFLLGNAFSQGTQVVRIDNQTDQPHFVEFDKLPDGTTLDQVISAMKSEMSGTPAAGGLTQQDIQPFYFVGTQSGQTKQWHEMTFDPGTYMIACWIGDIKKGGVPHALEGMIDVFTIGSPAATPVS
jgi:hypothetical protein